MTVSDEFPAELKQFIAQHIESLAQLEALLMLRSEPRREWDVRGTGPRGSTSPTTCARALSPIWSGAASSQRQSRPASAFATPRATLNCDRLLAQLGELYHERRVAVITRDLFESCEESANVCRRLPLAAGGLNHAWQRLSCSVRPRACCAR